MKRGCRKRDFLHSLFVMTQDCINLITLFFEMIKSTFGFNFFYILSAVLLGTSVAVATFKGLIRR